MKAMITFAVLLALGTLAQAKVAPRQDARIVNGSVDSTIPNGAESAVPEANYFRAQQSRLLPTASFPAVCSCACSTRRAWRNPATKRTEPHASKTVSKVM